MNVDLSNKVAIVTGAGQGIGEGIARVFAKSGAKVVLATRSQGNVPFAALMPPLGFDRLVWYMEHARAEQAAALPPYAVVLNAIGEPPSAR